MMFRKGYTLINGRDFEAQCIICVYRVLIWSHRPFHSLNSLIMLMLYWYCFYCSLGWCEYLHLTVSGHNDCESLWTLWSTCTMYMVLLMSLYKYIYMIPTSTRKSSSTDSELFKLIVVSMVLVVASHFITPSFRHILQSLCHSQFVTPELIAQHVLN